MCGKYGHRWVDCDIVRLDAEVHSQDPAQDGAQNGFTAPLTLTAQSGITRDYYASPRGAQPAEQASGDVSRTDVLFGNVPLSPAYAERHEGYGAASGEESPPHSLSREALQAAWHYDERHTLTIPAQPAAECGHTTARRWHTATGEWCDDCYALAARVLGGRP